MERFVMQVPAPRVFCCGQRASEDLQQGGRVVRGGHLLPVSIREEGKEDSAPSPLARHGSVQCLLVNLMFPFQPFGRSEEHTSELQSR